MWFLVTRSLRHVCCKNGFRQTKTREQRRFYGKNYVFSMKKQQKLVKIKNFQKRLKTFLGIAILKLHTKFHWATTNSFWVMREKSFVGGEAAAAAEASSSSQIGDFEQVIKSEPRRISTCGLRHLVLWDEIFPLKHSNRIKICGKTDFRGGENGQLLRRQHSKTLCGA